MKERDWDTEMLEASIEGGRGVANRYNQKVTVVENLHKNRMQRYFITMSPHMYGLKHLRPHLYILPDRNKCPVIRRARQERDKRRG